MTNSIGSPPYERRQAIGLALGVSTFIVLLLIPPPAGLSDTAWHVMAAAVWIAVWWVTEAVHPSVTALLPLALFPPLHILTPQEVSAAYADHVIFLFMGAFLIALAMEKWGLHQRLALHVLSRVGASPQALSLGIMATTAAISMWVSNVATTLIMLPIVIAVLDHATAQGYDTRKGFGTALMLMVAYGASIGGVGTPVGTPPNVIFIGAFSRLFPEAPPIGFFQWMLFGVPTVVVMVLITWSYMTYIAFRFPTTGWQADRQVLQSRLQALGPLSREEKRVALIAAATALLWIFREDLHLGNVTLPGWSSLLSPPVTVQDSTVAIVMAVVLFLIPADRQKGTFLLDWQTAERLPWSVLILLGGGLALAAGVEKSGLAAWLGSQLTSLSSLSVLSGMFMLTLLMAVLTEFTSNTAITTLMMPVLAATATGMRIDPLLLMIPATFAASICNFMLPSATGPNAIVFASGYITIPQMFRVGIVLDLIGVVVMTMLVYLIGIPVFGISLGGPPPWAR